MVEAMDHELGRLLTSLGAERLAGTHVIVVGDNGSQNDVTEEPFIAGHGKGTLFEGGVRVPLIVAGPAVATVGAECRALVNSVDLFATCFELGGATKPLPANAEFPRDSISLVPYLKDPSHKSLRQTIYSERFSLNHTVRDWRRAIRNSRFKLFINIDNGVEHFFDLERDPFEQTNLIHQEALSPEGSKAYGELKAALEALE